MALALKLMFTSGGYDARFERTRGITGLNIKWSDFRFMDIVSFLRIDSACFMHTLFMYLSRLKERKSVGFFFLP